MLTDTELKHLKPKAKPYKVTDRDGMYVLVSPGGTISFRVDYRLHGRRETVTLGKPARGDLVAIAPPAPLSAWLSERGYLPRGVPLLKRVAATHGALVCRSGVFVTIDGAPAARTRSADRMGRALPLWLGCRRLERGELFVLGLSPDSLDGRYFGPLPASAVIGTAHPILTRDASGAPLRWRRNGARHPLHLPDEEQTS